MPGFVQNALGIQSPSRVFAGIGRNIVAGLAKGIASSAGLATNAAAHMVDEVQRIELPIPSVVAAPISVQASASANDPSGADGLGRQVDALTRVVTQLVRGAGDLQTALSFAQP